MKRILAFIVMVTWGLWFGGIMSLFLFVTRLFAAGHGPETAPILFISFERYQLLISATALVATVLWRIAGAPSKLKIALFVLLALAGVSAVLSSTLITPRIDDLRLAGQSGTPEFKRLHSRSMMLYTTQAALLLLGGAIISWEIPGRRE